MRFEVTRVRCARETGVGGFYVNHESWTMDLESIGRGSGLDWTFALMHGDCVWLMEGRIDL